MKKTSKIVENNDFRTADVQERGHVYSIEVSEKEIDNALEDMGINPLHLRLYATKYSKNGIAYNIAIGKLKEILLAEDNQEQSSHKYSKRMIGEDSILFRSSLSVEKNRKDDLYAMRGPYKYYAIINGQEIKE
jgi:hypothetical protein